MYHHASQEKALEHYVFYMRMIIFFPANKQNKARVEIKIYISAL